MRAKSKELLEQLKAVKDTIPATSTDSVAKTQVKPPARKKKKAVSAIDDVQAAFSKEIESKLSQHEGPGKWTRKALLAELVADLPNAFPAIVYEGNTISESGVYRRTQRSADKTILHLITADETYNFTVMANSDQYKKWWQYYKNKGMELPGEAAIEMCIYQLEAYLQGFEDYEPEEWQKRIDDTQYGMYAGS